MGGARGAAPQAARGGRLPLPRRPAVPGGRRHHSAAARTPPAAPRPTASNGCAPRIRGEQNDDRARSRLTTPAAGDLARLHARLGGGRRARGHARRRVPHARHARRVAAAGRDAGRAGAGRVRRRGPRRGAGHLAERVSPRILHAPARLDAVARAARRVLRRAAAAFDVPLDLRLARGFRRAVLDHLPAIGYGQTESYAEVAAAAGSPRAVRAVGHRVRDEPAAGRRAVPPGGALGRRAGRVRGRSGREADPAGPGGGGMSRTLADRAGDWPSTRGARRARRARCSRGCCRRGECAAVAACYDDPARFRSTVDMARYRFGQGEYRYFAAPFPRARRRAAGGALPVAAADRPRLGGEARPVRPLAGHPRRSGWPSATRPGRRSRRRSCCATRRATGTRCTAICTATRCSRCRW